MYANHDIVPLTFFPTELTGIIVQTLPLRVHYRPFSESDVVREILFALLGFPDSIYEKVNGGFLFKVSDTPICLSHISPKALTNILNKFLITINEANSIRAIINPENRESPLHYYQSCVIEGFLSTIRDIQIDLELIVHNLEQKFNSIEYDDENNETEYGNISNPDFIQLLNAKEEEEPETVAITLINLISQLSLYTSLIHKLYVLVDKCIPLNDNHYPLRAIVYHIYNILYKECEMTQLERELYENQNININLDLKYSNYNKICSTLFYNSFRPYLLLLDQWLSTGTFVDVNSEFYLEKTSDKDNNTLYVISNQQIFEDNNSEIIVMIPPFLIDTISAIYNVGESLHTLYTMREIESTNTEDFYNTVSHSNTIIMDEFTRIYNNNNNKIYSFSILFKQCFTDIIYKRIEYINHQLITIYFEKYDLENHLNSLRDFYLCKEEEYIYEFSKYIYNLLRSHHPWQDSVNLSIHFDNCIEDILSNRKGLKESFHIEMFNISINPSKEVKSFDDINCLDSLDIKYNTPWPFNIILTDEIINKYYMIFQYLLTIRRVQYEMNSLYKSLIAWNKYLYLYNSDNYFKSIHDDSHQLQLNICEIKHFIDCFYSGVIDLILDPNSYNNMIKSMKESTNLSNIIDLHNKYLSGIMTNILLSSKTNSFMNIIKSILQTGLDFAHNYRLFMFNIFAELNLKDYYGSYQGLVLPTHGDGISKYNLYKERISENMKKFKTDLKFFLKILKTRLKTGMTKYLEYILLKIDMNDFYENN